MGVSGVSKYLFRPVDEVVREIGALPAADQDATLRALLAASRTTATIAEQAMSALGLDRGALLEYAVEDPWRSGLLDERSLLNVRATLLEAPKGPMTRAQIDALAAMGIEREHFGRVLAGCSVSFDMPAVTDTQQVMGGFVQLTPDSVASGVVLVRDVGGGMATLLAFRRRANALARAFDRPFVDFMGCELKNERLGRLLVRNGFEPATVEVPEVFGGGMMDVLTKRFDTREP